MNSTIKMLLVAIPAAALGGLVMALVMQPDVAMAQRGAPARLQPFEIRSGQTFDGYEVFFIVDPQNQQVVAVSYERGEEKLVPIGGRDLAKDFKINTDTSFSVATVQTSKSSGLLLVVNHTLQRAIVYEVDQNSKNFDPTATLDLSKIFKPR
ncbi:MAG: hypothetical protein ACLFUJ_13765 [Phycisphaerae bacterium]